MNLVINCSRLPGARRKPSAGIECSMCMLHQYFCFFVLFVIFLLPSRTCGSLYPEFANGITINNPRSCQSIGPCWDQRVAYTFVPSFQPVKNDRCTKIEKVWAGLTKSSDGCAAIIPSRHGFPGVLPVSMAVFGDCLSRQTFSETLPAGKRFDQKWASFAYNTGLRFTGRRVFGLWSC